MGGQADFPEEKQADSPWEKEKNVMGIKDRKEANFLKVYKARRNQSVCTNVARGQR
jgi:hypothetical protein